MGNARSCGCGSRRARLFAGNVPLLNRCAFSPCYTLCERSGRLITMKILRAVLVASSGVCTLAIAQAHADPTEAAANTPVAATTSPDTAGWELPKLPQMQ